MISLTVALAIAPFVSVKISFALPIFVTAAVLLGFVSFIVPLRVAIPDTFPFEVSIFPSAMFISLNVEILAAVMSALMLRVLVAVPPRLPSFSMLLFMVRDLFAADFTAKGLAFVPTISILIVVSVGKVMLVPLKMSFPLPANVML